jgi:hypothetical protein
MSAFFAVLAMFFIFPKVVSAQIVINEVFSNPSGSSSEPTEFVELYNTLDQDFDLTGFKLADLVKDFTLEATISAHSFLSFTRQDTKIALNNSSETISLLNPSGQVIDSFSYDSTVEDKSFSRIPDGTGGFVSNTDITKGEANQAPPTPTPTEEITSTPSPTSTPTSNPTNTPTTTPTTSLTENPTPTTSPSKESLSKPKVLSVATESSLYKVFFQDSTVSSSPSTQSASAQSKVGVNLSLVGLGLVILSTSVLFFRHRT